MVSARETEKCVWMRRKKHRRWRSQEFAAGYAKYKKKIEAKKFEVNTQYNERLSYTGHNKSIIITSGGLLRAGAGALALGRRGGCGLPLAELPLPRWGGREVGDELPDAGLGTGGGPRAESRGSEAHWGGYEARGTGASRKQRERAILLYFGLPCWTLLNWDHKFVYNTLSVPK